MPAIKNPVVDKVRSARKRYGAWAALWGLLTALYATGRDEEANRLKRGIENYTPEQVLDAALSLPDLGRAGEVLVGWAAHRYHIVEQKHDMRARWELQDLLSRAAHPVLEWTKRARPRPNLFDYSVEDAYEAAKLFLGGREKAPARQGPVFYRFDDGWTVQDLNTRALLVDEGNHQNNCVGQLVHGYPGRVERGEIKIYSLRDPDGDPHVTMTWDTRWNQLIEASADGNEKIEDREILDRLVEFAHHVGMNDVQMFLAGFVPAKDVELADADLQNAYLVGLDMDALDLRNTNLSESQLSHTSLMDCNLQNANLSKAVMYEAQLRWSDMSHANLTGATLNYSNLTEVDLSNANLEGATFAHAYYNANTMWPDGFDPVAAGATLIDD